MGVKMAAYGDDNDDGLLSRPHHHHQHHVGAPGFGATSSVAATAGGLPSSREEMVHGLAAYGGGGKLANLTGGCMGSGDNINIQENMSMLPSTSGFDGFDDSFNGIFSAKRNSGVIPSFPQDAHFMGLRREGGGAAAAGGGGGGGDGMTRDFLGLRGFPHRDFSNMAGLDQMGSSSSFDHQNQAPWQS